ncbi:hypothetical protein QP150_00050 [Sphingomonas sp. 22L2VL55-3]
MPATPYQSTNIERIVEDTGRLFRISANGGRIPRAALRARDAVDVEPGRDLNGGGAGRELGKDPLDDDSLCRVDLKQAPNDLAACVELDDPFVAIGAAAGETTGKHRGLHAPHRFVDEVFEEDRAQHARDCELDLVDMAF